MIQKSAVFFSGKTGIGALKRFMRIFFKKDDAAFLEIQILGHRIRNSALDFFEIKGGIDGGTYAMKGVKLGNLLI